MSPIEPIQPRDYINPAIKYRLFSDFEIDQKSETVYVINDFNHSAPKDSFLDLNKIPFKQGIIRWTTNAAVCDLKEQITIRKKIYNIDPQITFSKGAYCGRQYELAYKIDYINQNIRQGEQWLYSSIRLTHEGNAIESNGSIRVNKTLDLPVIEKAYSETYNRLHPNFCLQLAKQGKSLLNSTVNRVIQRKSFYISSALAGLAFGIALSALDRFNKSGTL